jgi:hypothetical protein
MGFTDPIYDCEETKGLTEAQLRRLRKAILHELNTSEVIRKLLRRKTQHLLPQSASKKRTARQRKK